MAQKFDIQDKLPILIGEKTGPHFAIGDTCFSMSEDSPVYNNNGKEVVARDNEKSCQRVDNVEEAYTYKHTDITIPYNENNCMETTIGQLNFFKWALQHKVIDYIEQHYQHIEQDMNNRNSTSKRKDSIDETKQNDKSKTRKKREELSISACKCIKKESVKIIVKFN